jgi:hypothetical protein
MLGNPSAHSFCISHPWMVGLVLFVGLVALGFTFAAPIESSSMSALKRSWLDCVCAAITEDSGPFNFLRSSRRFSRFSIRLRVSSRSASSLALNASSGFLCGFDP